MENRQTLQICVEELKDVFFDTQSVLQSSKVGNISPIEKLVQIGIVIY